MTFKRQYGSDRVVKDNDQKTPQQKKFEQATGKDSDSATGDVNKRIDNSDSGIPAPKGADKDLWAQAENSAIGLNGGFGGVGREGRERQIQEQYDKMVESDKQTKEWAGGSGILGDIGETKEK